MFAEVFKVGEKDDKERSIIMKKWLYNLGKKMAVGDQEGDRLDC